MSQQSVVPTIPTQVTTQTSYAVACRCKECDEITHIVDICKEHGYNPGTDGHFFNKKERAIEWANEMNLTQPIAAKYSDPDINILYIPVKITIERIS